MFREIRQNFPVFRQRKKNHLLKYSIVTIQDLTKKSKPRIISETVRNCLVKAMKRVMTVNMREENC